MKTTQLHHQVALTLLEGVGPKSARSLVAYMGSPSAIFNEKKNLRTTIPGFSKERFRHLNTTKALLEAEKVVDFIEKHNLKATFYLDEDYPYRLKQCQDAPTLLYSKGDFELNPKRSIAIVGTRNMTTYGKKIIKELVSSLKPFNVQIVSGLAYGVDVCTHRCCLDYDISTVGVLGHGLDRVYPSHHREVAKKMMSSNGGLLTEFPNGTNPDRENFPKRNRIVAGITDATIIVESGKKGGSLITAHLANDYSRDVFAYPGNIDSPYSIGCNNLIASDKAHLVTCANDIIKMLDWEVKEKPKPIQTNIFQQLTGDEKKVVKKIKEFEKISLDVLSVKLKTPVSILSALLLNLELKGIIMTLPGKKYTLGM
ncbi:MAG: DNA-processing protein DprA [Brumimicrobium sp.]